MIIETLKICFYSFKKIVNNYFLMSGWDEMIVIELYCLFYLKWRKFYHLFHFSN